LQKSRQHRNIDDAFSSIGLAMKSLQPLIAFAETAKQGSFAAASRELGAAPSTLAKAVARLEASLGVRLFHRTTRQVSLTPDGERLFQRCQRVLTELEDLQADAAGTRAVPAGTLKVDAPIAYGKRVVLPALAALVRQHPGLQLDVRLSDSYADIVRDGIDLAVRVGRLADSTLVARAIDHQQLVLCASPQYLQSHGVPRRLDDLQRHVAVLFRQPTSGRSRAWAFRRRGEVVEFHPASRVRVNDGEGMVAAALCGLGICQVPELMVTDALADGRLTELLPGLRPEPAPISLVWVAGRVLPARLRVAIDALAAMRTIKGDGGS
jgi:LysR family transcriptional regulator, regulator for bpeEF and oprC